jgi:hypothetical protein
MKRWLIVTCVVSVTAVLGVVVAAVQGKPQEKHQDVYFGFLLGTSRVAGVAIDLAPADKTGQRALRAYVCDGLGFPKPPDSAGGIAIWFKGSVRPEGVSNDTPLLVKSVGGLEDLRLTAVTDRAVYGAFTEASGAKAHFVAYPAIDGAGIYQVTLDESLHYTGTSTDGASLDAQVVANGTTTGTIKPAGGKKIDFTVRNLALATPDELTANGLPVEYALYKNENQVPGSYVAVIAPGGSHWFGRAGFVQGGALLAEIIGLDKKIRRQ